MKKFLSSVLTLSLLTSMGAPALAAAQADTMPAKSASGTAAGALDERLAAVTRMVKSSLPIEETLAALGGEPEFNGNANDNAFALRWNLEWSVDAGSISAVAGEDGKIYSYNLYSRDSGRRNFWGLDAAFSKADKDKALAAAQEFADRLMASGESVRLTASSRARGDVLEFTGTLLLNGLPSPVAVSVQLRPDDLAVTRYHRDDCYSSIRPEIPSPESRTDAAKAAGLLRSTIELTPYYVIGKDNQVASLRYVRESEKNYIVNAADGKLVDLDEVYADLADSYNESGAKRMAFTLASYTEDAAADTGTSPAEASGGAQLSDAELKTIEGLKDVHGREQLDQVLRGISALGLDEAWTLERISYSQNRDTDEIFANLRYARPLTEEERTELEEGYEGELLQISKTVQINARTDALKSVYTSNPAQTERMLVQRNQPQTDEQRKAAEQFLKEHLPERWEESGIYTREDDKRLMYAQRVNGYLFPANLIAIRMDENNLVDSLNVDWDDSISFTGVNDIVSAEEAVDACMKAFEMPLAYVEYPVLEDQIMSQKYVLAYAFRYGDDRRFGGIDARTGQPVWDTYGSTGFSYQDLAGAEGRAEIEALATYGIGLPGSRFEPKAKLDQKTMLVLLLSACGNEADPSTEQGLDELYQMAYSENLIRASEREPDAGVTRMMFLKTLLDASIYGDAAKVKGIYTCPYSDRSSIAEEDLGYAALAYGLGMVRGDEKGRLNPDHMITRQEAAVMLYGFMMR